ncbi:MAG: hypothetical protein HOK98_08405 [Rhodospirillaceae bacterium]|nr:hypothetical protein [Rhodospirillaceae bacterium]MBT5945613.1 hypothetical protein [Rhodospirillaceae bacterium]MBT6403839.1 hypothetical protein [Rhodospirillaceae bacterium]MBT6536194.1 hypothetical protein [Rhodospirillaceae bacterium]MBT7362487.1 hypothetical protein [Rhodospirillaceae bacterium]
MTDQPQECLVVGVFGDVETFSTALEELVAGGFRATDISILGNHQSLLDHFGTIPSVEELTDRMDTPRESLASHETLDDVIGFLSDSLAIVAQVGTAAAAFVVGGPIGVSTGAAEETEESIGGFLERISDQQWRHRLEQSAGDGGIICWVRATDGDTAKAAEDILAQADGGHIHRTDPLPPTVWPID